MPSDGLRMRSSIGCAGAEQLGHYLILDRNEPPTFRHCLNSGYNLGTRRRRRRRRRRCGPPVGRTRGTSPWCLPALTGLTATERGVFVPTRAAKHHGGGSPLRLLPLSPGPHNVHALPPYTLLEPPRGTNWGARQSASSTSGTVRHPPSGRGTRSHGCGPLAPQVLPTGRRLAGRSRGLGP